MPVVINEFEVVAPPSGQSAAPAAAAAAPAAPPDLELMLSRERARHERVRAY